MISFLSKNEKRELEIIKYLLSSNIGIISRI